MKKCKYCGTDIDSKAKICPNCKKKQSKKGKYIILGIIAIIIIGIIVSNNDEKRKEEERKKEFTQNEVATYKEVSYSITKVEKTQGKNEFLKPKDGYEYVKVTIKIENNSKEKISYNALDWQMVNSDGVEDAWGSITAEEDRMLNSGELDAGGKVEGVLIWEQKKGDNNLRLRYYDNVLFDKKYTLEFKIN